ncbi:MAG: ferredoxin [Candidatus Woesearchaeota archaeon]
MGKYKINYVEEECIGDGVCSGLCPDNWEMVEKDGQMKAHPITTDLDDLGCNQDAAEQCPASCIHIIDTKTGKQII